MRLSLRTLLAFEDNVFDVEQHRRLEQIIPTDNTAVTTLNRIRSVMRNSQLGVPGLVDHQEELDPNYVAEYLDHQMSENVQNQFETYCLSTDKYLAEIASIHHILSNVLGEPARTSRDCRLKCYNALTPAEPSPIAPSKPAKPEHFDPYPQEKVPASNRRIPQLFAPILKLFFRSQAKTAAQTEPRPQSSLWNFCAFGLMIAAALFGWQQIEKQNQDRSAHPEPMKSEHFSTLPQEPNIKSELPLADIPKLPEPARPEPMKLEPILQTDYTAELPTVEPATEPVTEKATPELADPFANTSVPPKPEQYKFEPKPEIPEPIVPKEINVTKKMALILEQSEPKNDEPVISFQDIKTPTLKPLEPLNDSERSALPVTVWQPISPPPPAPPIQKPARLETALTLQPQMPAIVQTSAVNVRALGHAVPTNEPSMIFLASDLNSQWQLPPLPFDLNADQYLLTAAPFRGTLELAAGYQIEMIGDAKLCILPPDTSGIQGIFVDYGRIVIRPLKADQPLRIEMEKSRGIVKADGTNSVFFIDTFAEINEPNVQPMEGQKPKMSPILGFVPKNGDHFSWKSLSQSQPFVTGKVVSLILSSDQYRWGEIKSLPNWVNVLPMLPEDRQLAEICRRFFVDAKGDSVSALQQMTHEANVSVRALSYRLLGDLGDFGFSVRLMTAKRLEDEPIRRMLVPYFNEVMKRDSETVQRFADTIEAVKVGTRN